MARTVGKVGGVVGISGITAIWSGGTTYAATGDPAMAVKAAARDFANADLVEGSILVTVDLGEGFVFQGTYEQAVNSHIFKTRIQGQQDHIQQTYRQHIDKNHNVSKEDYQEMYQRALRGLGGKSNKGK